MARRRAEEDLGDESARDGRHECNSIGEARRSSAPRLIAVGAQATRNGAGATE